MYGTRDFGILLSRSLTVPLLLLPFNFYALTQFGAVLLMKMYKQKMVKMVWVVCAVNNIGGCVFLDPSFSIFKDYVRYYQVYKTNRKKDVFTYLEGVAKESLQTFWKSKQMPLEVIYYFFMIWMVDYNTFQHFFKPINIGRIDYISKIFEHSLHLLQILITWLESFENLSILKRK